MDASAPIQGCPECERLRRQVEQLQQQVKELQARLDQNSSNSHKPPSSDPPWARKLSGKKPTGGNPGGQQGHSGHHRKRLPPERVNRYVHHVPSRCKHCRAPLPQEAQAGDPEPTWHQVAELPEMTALVTEHQGHARRCVCCGTITRQQIPDEVRAWVIGPRLAATMSYLSGRCHDGRRTVQEIAADVFQVPLSLGTVINYEKQMSDALGGSHRQALKHVRQAAAKHVDETGWKRGKRHCWLWVAASATVACFAICAGRDAEALGDLLGKRAGKVKVLGMICSDRWVTYQHVPVDQRQICWAHLQRDFQKWLELGRGRRGDGTWYVGREGLKVCKAVFRLWRGFARGKLKRLELGRRLRPVRAKLGQVLRWSLRCGVKQAVSFCRRLLACEPALWSFARRRELEPTNNHAERALRAAVLWRKNSFGAASHGGCRFVERMLTAVQTLRLQGRGVLAWLVQTLEAHRANRPGPALVI